MTSSAKKQHKPMVYAALIVIAIATVIPKAKAEAEGNRLSWTTLPRLLQTNHFLVVNPWRVTREARKMNTH